MGKHVKNWVNCVHVNTISVGLRQLEGLRAKPDVTEKRAKELDWEIKLYKWILVQTDCEDKAKVYLNRRHFEQKIMPKREVVRLLGWPL